MKRSTMHWYALALVAAALTGCGGGGGGGATAPVPATPLGQAIAAAAAVAANDTSSNSASAFKVLQDAGVPAMTVPAGGAAKVNFTVFSDKAVRTGLTNANVRIAIAKLVPGTGGEIDQWQSYVYRTETAAANVGPGGRPLLASALQATTDPNTAASLSFNADGYYIYTFTTNLRDPARTGGVTFEPNRTHRVAIQLSYTNALGETVRVNPYFDITFDASGNSVAVTDAAKTRVMADVSSCNGCHERLALHGGGRVDVQFCVMCHNPKTTDANSGNVLTMQTMVHKIHAGRRLAQAVGGEHYTIWGFGNAEHGYAEVGFPQDLRNCTVCHTAANPKTPQGDNWKTRPSKESCLTCHANGPGSDFYVRHALFTGVADPRTLPNSACVDCHRPGVAIAPERVHWNQNEENGAKYRMNIDSATYDAAARKVTVKYYLSDPTSNNAAYNLVTPDCTAAAPDVCAVREDPADPRSAYKTKFGNLRFYLAYQNMVGQATTVTEFTAYNNGGSSANAFAYRGSNDGTNRYTVDIPLPADSANAVAAGTARVVSIGQIKEPMLEIKTVLEPRPQVVPTVLINTVVQHSYKDVVLTGTMNPRRQVVANEKCNVCHGALGTTSGSNTLANAFHSGARNTVEACMVCHDANRMSSTVMTNGLALSENYQFKRMIHGIHGNSRRTYPFTHGNSVIGAFGKDGLLKAAGLMAGAVATAPAGTQFTPFASATVVPAGTPFAAGVENYAAEVAYPDVGVSCRLCHVNDSYKVDRGVMGAVVSKPLVGSPLAADANPLNWRVISPMSATCTACHDSATAMGHVTSFGNGSFGNRTQAQSLLTKEICADCHASGLFKGVDIVHGLK